MRLLVGDKFEYLELNLNARELHSKGSFLRGR